MRRAIELAARAQGHTCPNPCVGCVIVDTKGQVIGEGWHERSGQPHAEVRALLEAVSGETAGATAYVSLEPCNHYGRTPPCTLALLKHGISRVVVGLVDPDPRVAGQGLSLLRDRGAICLLAPESSLEAALCRDLNAPFVFRVTHGRPLA
ncbi:cytidine deaminase-like protein, partial [Ochromonadaceae sp. CCMP2298]